MLTNIIYFDQIKYKTKINFSILETGKFLGIQLARFCYHKNLPIAGNCRMCLVEVFKHMKPIPACITLLPPHAILKTTLSSILKLKENILEFILLNHPLDCPVCDQADECDLQDQTYIYGVSVGRQSFKKNTINLKNWNTLIKVILTRCIFCTRCLRIENFIEKRSIIGLMLRGTHTELSLYREKKLMLTSSTALFDVCPVGALTAKKNAFKVRPENLIKIFVFNSCDPIGFFLQYLLAGGLLLKTTLIKATRNTKTFFNIFIRPFWLSNLLYACESQLLKSFMKKNWTFFSFKKGNNIPFCGTFLDPHLSLQAMLRFIEKFISLMQFTGGNYFINASTINLRPFLVYDMEPIMHNKIKNLKIIGSQQIPNLLITMETISANKKTYLRNIVVNLTNKKLTNYKIEYLNIKNYISNLCGTLFGTAQQTQVLFFTLDRTTLLTELFAVADQCKSNLKNQSMLFINQTNFYGYWFFGFLFSAVTQNLFFKLQQTCVIITQLSNIFTNYTLYGFFYCVLPTTYRLTLLNLQVKIKKNYFFFNVIIYNITNKLFFNLGSFLNLQQKIINVYPSTLKILEARFLAKMQLKNKSLIFSSALLLFFIVNRTRCVVVSNNLLFQHECVISFVVINASNISQLLPQQRCWIE